MSQFVYLEMSEMCMERDSIAEIGIDHSGRLYVVPSLKKFPYIYREAVQVHWDEQGGFLYSPVPKEWTYLQWFVHIVEAAKLQSCQLYLTVNTKWCDVPTLLKDQILAKQYD